MAKQAAGKEEGSLEALGINESLKEIVDGAKTEIKAQLVAQVKSSLADACHWQLSQAVKAEVETFVAAEIVPELRKQLLDEKGTILEAAVRVAQATGAELENALIKEMTENLGQSWKRHEMMKTLFE